ncbi:MAG: hypothetical protein D6755_00480 [Anaerolineae bacterium]|nr:MAG: hypothetical protein D6755_00480 [Anaerolineae bacterium]
MLLTIHAVEKSQGFVPLLLVIALAFLVPILLSRFRSLPVVVGEILAGVIIGPSLFNILEHSLTLDFLGDIGLAFLMFLAGLEIDLETILPKQDSEPRPNYLRQAGVVYFFTLLLALPAAYLLQGIGLQANPLLLVFVLSATSLGVLLPILKERDLLPRPFGQMVFISATLADFLTVLLFTVYILTSENGFTVEIFSVGLLFLVFLVVMRLAPPLVRLKPVERVFEELSRATVQIKVRGAIAIMLAFVVLAEAVNAELILGAFLAGVVISWLRSPDDTGLLHNLEAFGFGFFIPIFFILVGADLDLRALFAQPRYLLILPVLLVVSILVKGLPMFLLRGQFSWREMLSSGFLLNTHLSLEIAVVVIGERVGLVDTATSALIILFSALTVVLMPLVFGALQPETPHHKHTWKLLYGQGQTTRQVAEVLRAHGDEVRLLPADPSQTAALTQAGYPVIQPQEPHTPFTDLDVQEIETLLLLDGSDQQKLEIARQARQAGITDIVVQLDAPALLPEFQALNAQVYLPGTRHVTMLTLMARNPDLLTLLESTQDDRDVREVTLHNRTLAGKTLRSLHLPADCLVLSLRRDDHIIIPRGDMRLQYGDRLTLLGKLDVLTAVHAWLEGDAPAPTHSIPSINV